MSQRGLITIGALLHAGRGLPCRTQPRARRLRPNAGLTQEQRELVAEFGMYFKPSQVTEVTPGLAMALDPTTSPAWLERSTEGYSRPMLSARVHGDWTSISSGILYANPNMPRERIERAVRIGIWHGAICNPLLPLLEMESGSFAEDILKGVRSTVAMDRKEMEKTCGRFNVRTNDELQRAWVNEAMKVVRPSGTEEMYAQDIVRDLIPLLLMEASLREAPGGDRAADMYTVRPILRVVAYYRDLFAPYAAADPR